jgi:hypothetical protein
MGRSLLPAPESMGTLRIGAALVRVNWVIHKIAGAGHSESGYAHPELGLLGADYVSEPPSQ